MNPNNNAYVCSVCGEEYAQMASFLEHHQQHPDNERAKYECVGCLKRFRNAIYFRTHIMRVHENKGKLFIIELIRCVTEFDLQGKDLLTLRLIKEDFKKLTMKMWKM